MPYRTYQQERAEFMERQRQAGYERLRGGEGDQTIYIYRPGMLDASDPKVIRGRPIQPGAHVVIINYPVDPMGKFAFVMDAEGNEQSVYTRSLEPVWTEGTRPANPPYRRARQVRVKGHFRSKPGGPRGAKYVHVRAHKRRR